MTKKKVVNFFLFLIGTIGIIAFDKENLRKSSSVIYIIVVRNREPVRIHVLPVFPNFM